MSNSSDHTPRLLLLVAGAKGAIGSTLAAAVAAMHQMPELILPGLTTADQFSFLGPCQDVAMTGWDPANDSLAEALARHGVLPQGLWRPHQSALMQMTVFEAPDPSQSLSDQISRLHADIQDSRKRFPHAQPVLINLLPAACDISDPEGYASVDQLVTDADATVLPDLAYVLAAILDGIPVINFTPNTVELPAICQLAVEKGVPLAGRDGKTGQTFFKVVLASALKARGLYVDGWYSLNILGNADGLNLMDPDNASGKLNNKTHLLDDILGYRVGQRYGQPTHKVHIDYYPPRGDAKEAWDVVDITGIFGLPMSLRINLQGRDSILATPMVLDLARWTAALHTAGIAGPVAELGFYFKRPIGLHAPLTFEDQFAALKRLADQVESRITTADTSNRHDTA
jgi:myo-inositol-1-phosphate synthase